MQAIRLYAVYSISLGARAEDLAPLYQTSHKSICNWVHQYNRHGVDGLKDRERQGRPSRLNEEQLRSLSGALSDTPEHHGFSSGTWTGAMVIEHIKRQWGVEYKRANIYNVIRRLGFTFQRAGGVYPEREPRAERVRAIKKTRGAGG